MVSEQHKNLTEYWSIVLLFNSFVTMSQNIKHYDGNIYVDINNHKVNPNNSSEIKKPECKVLYLSS